MGGLVTYEEDLAAMLDLFIPSVARVQDFLEKRPPKYIGDGLMNNLRCIGWQAWKGLGVNCDFSFNDHSYHGSFFHSLEQKRVAFEESIRRRKAERDAMDARCKYERN